VLAAVESSLDGRVSDLAGPSFCVAITTFQELCISPAMKPKITSRHLDNNALTMSCIIIPPQSMMH
jgi:hypothetical protein